MLSCLHYFQCLTTQLPAFLSGLSRVIFIWKTLSLLPMQYSLGHDRRKIHFELCLTVFHYSCFLVSDAHNLIPLIKN